MHNGNYPVDASMTRPLTNMPLSLPAGFPMLADNASYELRRVGPDVGPGNSLAGTLTPGAPPIIIDSQSKWVNSSQFNEERYDLVGKIGGKGVVLGTLVVSVKKDKQIRGAGSPELYGLPTYSWRMEYPSRLVIPKSSDARVEVIRRSGAAGDPTPLALSTLNAYTYPGYTGPTGALDTVQSLDMQGWAQGSYTIEIRTYNADGAVQKVMQEVVTVGAAGNVSAGALTAVQLDPVEFRGMPNGHAAIYLNTPAHASGLIWLRFYGADENFRPIPYSGGFIDLTDIDGGLWNRADSGYQYVIETNGQFIAGSYHGGGGGGIPWDRSNPIYRTPTGPQNFTFSPDYQAVAGSPAFSKYVVEFDISYNGQTSRLTRELGSASAFTVSESDFSGWVGRSAFSRSAPVSYVYRVFAGEGTGRRLAAQGQGAMTTGRSNVSAVGATSYPAIANLGVPNLAGNVKLTVGGRSICCRTRTRADGGRAN
ncbi:hypothetical protein ACQ86G_18960 [Roseateles chitinivorans]|uniref:hypothetical protein n=1 Tax=Roseateles chitinivorans TaxID=2917965 RepID=UPI003D67AA47